MPERGADERTIRALTEAYPTALRLPMRTGSGRGSSTALGFALAVPDMRGRHDGAYITTGKEAEAVVRLLHIMASAEVVSPAEVPTHIVRLLARPIELWHRRAGSTNPRYK